MELDVEMASLELNEKKRRFSAICEAPSESENTELGASDATASTSVRRSLRKKVRPLDVDKRRVYTKPKKIGVGAANDVTGYYLDKKVKLVHTSLETIFEEPKNTKDIMGGRKFRRLINFSPNSTDKVKTKKRQMKAKKVCTTKFLRSKKVTKELILQKLKEIESIQET